MMAGKKKWKRRATRARRDASVAELRADAASKRARVHKRRAKATEKQVAILADLNRELIARHRVGRADDACSMHYATEAIGAFATDAAALHSVIGDRISAEYLEYLTFRLRQNLSEASSFLEDLGQAEAAADLSDLLNELPGDATSSLRESTG